MSTTWHDNDGRHWRFAVNMWTCKQVKAAAGWDLPNILNDGMAKLSELLADKSELFSVWLVLLDSQLNEHGVTPGEFGEAVAGDKLADATEAFVEALADFFPSRQAAQLKALLAKGREVSEALATMADAELEKIEVSTLTEQVLSGLGSAG